MKKVGFIAIAVFVLVGAREFENDPNIPYEFTTLQFPGASGTRATGLNRSGQVVGIYDLSTQTEQGSFILEDGQFTEIIFSGSTDTLTNGINELGEIVGSYSLDGGLTRHGFLLTPDGFEVIDFPGAIGTAVNGINDNQDIAGIYLDPTGNVRGFFRDSSTLNFSTIDAPGAISTFVEEVNVDQQMAGDYVDASGNFRGFVSSPGSPGSFVDIEFPGASDTFLSGINDNGVVAGTYLLSGGDTLAEGHGFLFDGEDYRTIDFPPSFTTLGTGILGLDNWDRIAGFYGEADAAASCNPPCPGQICCGDGTCVDTVTACSGSIKLGFFGIPNPLLVPSLSDFGLLVFGGLLSVSGFLLLRRWAAAT